jgi:hypothetical protein
MSKYYIAIEGSQQGPFSLDELRKKNITKTTLVWTETMDNWVEAVNLEELKDILRTIPPPIPAKVEKAIKVEAEISRKKEKLISPQTEVVVAKETKSVFQKIVYGLILGAVSFPIFYFAVHQANKYDNFDVYKEVHIRGNMMSGIDISDFPFSWSGMDYLTVQRNIERRKEILTEKSMYSAFITFLIASLVLIAFRYISKGAKWVQETSAKEV